MREVVLRVYIFWMNFDCENGFSFLEMVRPRSLERETSPRSGSRGVRLMEFGVGCLVVGVDLAELDLVVEGLGLGAGNGVDLVVASEGALKSKRSLSHVWKSRLLYSDLFVTCLEMKAFVKVALPDRRRFRCRR